MTWLELNWADCTWAVNYQAHLGKAIRGHFSLVARSLWNLQMNVLSIPFFFFICVYLRWCEIHNVCFLMLSQSWSIYQSMYPYIFIFIVSQCFQLTVSVYANVEFSPYFHSSSCSKLCNGSTRMLHPVMNGGERQRELERKAPCTTQKKRMVQVVLLCRGLESTWIR